MVNIKMYDITVDGITIGYVVLDEADPQAVVMDDRYRFVERVDKDSDPDIIINNARELLKGKK